MKSLILFTLLFSFNSKAMDCEGDKPSIYTSVLPLDFERDRSTVGRDQVGQVKDVVLDFAKSNPSISLKSITVTSMTPKAAFYTTVKGKKVIDPKSDERNLSLAKQRSDFALKALNEIRNEHAQFKEVEVSTRGVLSGPEFDDEDLNTRFVTNMTPGYAEKVKAIFEQNKALYENNVMIYSTRELVDEKIYSNLYHVKFAPFNALKVSIIGCKKLKVQKRPKKHSSSIKQ